MNQLGLFDEPKWDNQIDKLLSTSKRILLKHNALISISGDLNENQYKAYNIFLFVAKQVLSNINENQTLFRLKVRTLGEFTGIEFWQNYEYMKEIIEGIKKISVETDVLNRAREDKIEWGFMYLLASATIKKGNITFSFPAEILEALKSPRFYTKIDLNTIKALNGKYSIMLYENLLSYKNMKGMLFSIEDFRKLMGLENKYESIGDLKRYAVEPAIQEINDKTGMEVTVKYIRIKRKIKAIQFKINNAEEVFSEKEKSEKLLTIRGLFDNCGIKYDPSDANQFLEYDLDMIKKGIEKVVENKPRNHMAYLHDVLKKYQKYGFFSIEELEELKEDEKKEMAEQQKRIIDMAGIDIKEIAKKMKEK